MAISTEILNRIAALAEHEATTARGNGPVRMTALRRHEFDDLVGKAGHLLRAVPISAPRDPVQAKAFEQALRHAWHLAGHVKEHRAALRGLAEEVGNAENREWSIKRAMKVEAHPAMLAVWIAIGSSALPLLVRNGVLPSQDQAAEAIERLATQLRGSRGRSNDVHANFDAAVMMLLRALAIATRRRGRNVIRASLSNAAAGDQIDTGPGSRFVRAAIDILEPSVSQFLGAQAIAASVRRIRNTLYG